MKQSWITSIQAGVTLAVVAIAMCGCTRQKNTHPYPTIDPQVRADMAKPIDCGTAKRDVQILEDEKASVGKQILAGARTVLPISTVVGLLTGDFSDRAAVASGTYNEAIENKIQQIKATCGGFGPKPRNMPDILVTEP